MSFLRFRRKCDRGTALFLLVVTAIVLCKWQASARSKTNGGDPALEESQSKSSSPFVLKSNSGHAAEKQDFEGAQRKSSTEKIPESQTPDDETPFCFPNMNMVMFMDGFRRSLGSKENPSPYCLNYYFRTWTLSGAAKFHGAVVISILLALLTEGLSALRGAVLKHLRKGKIRRFLMVIIYASQQFMGYVIMITAMMYSIELFCAVLVGLTIGNLLFGRRLQPSPRDTQLNAVRQPLLMPGTLRAGYTV